LAGDLRVVGLNSGWNIRQYLFSKYLCKLELGHNIAKNTVPIF